MRALFLLRLCCLTSHIVQDNRNTQGDVSRSAIFARQLDFCAGEKKSLASIVVCLLE